VTRGLEAAKASLGLRAQDGLREYNQITDAFGSTHVRYHQTYRGVEVFNGTVLGHVDAGGNLAAPLATIQPDIDLQPAALLDEARIRAIVTANLAEAGRLWPIQVKPIVFPTKYQDGLKFVPDAQGALELDPRYHVLAPRRPEAYRWAYRASAMQATGKGLVATEFVIDGLTGQILKMWDGIQHADTPAVGTGASQYNGAVSLDTVQLADSGLFTLRDATRATQPWPNPFGVDWPEWAGIGSQTLAYDPNGPNWMTSYSTPYTSPVNTWGNGQAYAWGTDHPAGLFQPVGQTAAVDAHYSVQFTWDYYDKVLGRPGGIDGLGSSVISLVHVDNGNGGALNNAGWSAMWFMMQYGDGSATGPLTTLDVAAHEVSHGVMSYTANLDGAGFESAGLNEANSDIHATMAKYYHWGAGDQGGVVPDTTTQAPQDNNTWQYLWTMGPQLSADGTTPLRWLYKPSKDGMSYDAWFDGVGIEDSHFSMGPGNRAFFFLSRGASADASQETHSTYLPGGMTGIGNDKAIRIWFHAMTTKVTDIEANYHAIREAMIASAAELFPGAGGADSTEMAAVRNAFAAINVGAPAGGQEPVQVRFAAHPTAPTYYRSSIIWPATIALPLPKPAVTNAADTSVTWSLGGLSYLVPEGGRFGEGDTFVAPYVPRGHAFPVKATSKADPRQAAVTLVFSVLLDTDSDFDTDACDLGAMAYDYFAVFGRYPSTNILGSPWGGADDYGVEAFLEGFNNAFNQ